MLGFELTLVRKASGTSAVPSNFALRIFLFFHLILFSPANTQLQASHYKHYLKHTPNSLLHNYKYSFFPVSFPPHKAKQFTLICLNLMGLIKQLTSPQLSDHLLQLSHDISLVSLLSYSLLLTDSFKGVEFPSVALENSHLLILWDRWWLYTHTHPTTNSSQTYTCAITALQGNSMVCILP